MRNAPAPTHPLRIPETIYTLIERMFWWGMAAFAIGIVYVAWGIISGHLDQAMHLPLQERNKVVQNIVFAGKIILCGGGAFLIGTAARFYREETLGYVLLIAGAAFFWGLPAVVGPVFQGFNSQVLNLAVYAIKQVQVVGMGALALAVPFILADFWARLSGVRRFRIIESPTKPDQPDQPQKSNLYLFCWQMPYCRDYLRKVCTAYEQKKPCWRIKSGCYCDENMILKVLQRSKTSKLPGFDQKYSKPDLGLTKNLTPAQKRARCRQCFLYIEHQKQKYKLVSPLAFPAVIALMWMYLKPMKAILAKALEFTDQFAGAVSFGPKPDQVATNPWLDKAATSSTVEWVFIICIGLIVLSYVLRAVEYAVFDLKI